MQQAVVARCRWLWSRGLPLPDDARPCRLGGPMCRSAFWPVRPHRGIGGSSARLLTDCLRCTRYLVNPVVSCFNRTIFRQLARKDNPPMPDTLAALGGDPRNWRFGLRATQ